MVPYTNVGTNEIKNTKWIDSSEVKRRRKSLSCEFPSKEENDRRTCCDIEHRCPCQWWITIGSNDSCATVSIDASGDGGNDDNNANSPVDRFNRWKCQRLNEIWLLAKSDKFSWKYVERRQCNGNTIVGGRQRSVGGRWRYGEATPQRQKQCIEPTQSRCRRRWWRLHIRIDRPHRTVAIHVVDCADIVPSATCLPYICICVPGRFDFWDLLPLLLLSIGCHVEFVDVTIIAIPCHFIYQLNKSRKCAIYYHRIIDNHRSPPLDLIPQFASGTAHFNVIILSANENVYANYRVFMESRESIRSRSHY